MSAEQAVKLAESSPGLSAILIGGMHAVVGREAAEKAESRGAEFNWLIRHSDRIVSIPNANDGP